MAGLTVSVVTDKELALVATGQVTSSSSTAVVTGQVGGGYVVLMNTEQPGGKTIYLDGATASSTTFPLVPGAAVTWPLKDVTALVCYGTGGVLGWALLR